MVHLALLTSLATDIPADNSGSGSSIAGGLVSYLITAVSLYGVFKKAGEPPWAAFVPLYNLFVLVRVAGYNPWMFLLFIIPLVNVVFGVFVALGVGRAFGRSGAFSIVLLWLLSVIGLLIVGYGSAQFIGRGGRRLA